MRIFITSTPEELEPHQLAACDVAAELGHQPLLRDPTRGRGLKPVAACARASRQALPRPPALHPSGPPRRT
ncbi:MAG: hypothetical protein V3T72_07055 [Thermoanaerobaculia bacterium]